MMITVVVVTSNAQRIFQVQHVDACFNFNHTYRKHEPWLLLWLFVLHFNVMRPLFVYAHKTQNIHKSNPGWTTIVP